MDRGFGNFSNPASVSGGRPFGGYKMPQSNPSITHPGVGSSSSGGANYQGNFDQDAQRSREMGYSYKHEEAKQGERIEGGSSQSLRDVLHSIHGQDNVMSDNLNGVTERMKSIVNWSYAHGKKDLNHIKSIDLSGGRFNGDVLEFCKVMNCSHFSLHSIHLNDNGNAFGDKELDVVIKAIRGGKSRAYEHITSEPVSRLTAVNVSSSEFKYSPEDNRFIQQKITYLNLSNCNLTDASADMIASSLTYGHFHNHPIQARYLTNTKVIDVSGNNITAKGEGLIAKAMQSKYVQDLIVKTKKINDMSKMLNGTNEEKKIAYKYCIQLAKERGVYEDHIVVQKDHEKIISITKDSMGAVFGLAKCWIVPESLMAYAKGKFQGKMIAMLPKTAAKTVGKAIDVEDKVSCLLDFSEDLCASKSGIEAIKQELCIMGETEFCNDQ